MAARRDAGALRDANQIRHGGDAELLHDAAPMNLDCLLSRVQLRRNLFVQKTHHDKAQNFKLTRGQFLDTSTRFPSFPASAQLFLSTSKVRLRL